MEHSNEFRIRFGFLTSITCLSLYGASDIAFIAFYGVYWVPLVNAIILFMLILYSCSVMQTRKPQVANLYASVMACFCGLEVLFTLIGLIVILTNE